MTPIVNLTYFWVTMQRPLSTLPPGYLGCNVLTQIPLAAMADGEASDSLSNMIKEHLLVLFVRSHCLLACLLMIAAIDTQRNEAHLENVNEPPALSSKLLNCLMYSTLLQQGPCMVLTPVSGSKI